METRLTLRVGRHGPGKLVDRFGERLVRVRYLYDAGGGATTRSSPCVSAGTKPICASAPSELVPFGAPRISCGSCAGATYAASVSRPV